MKKFNCAFLLFSITLGSTAIAATRNLCDDLIDSGKSSEEQVKKCQDKFGVSEYSKTRADQKRIEEEQRKAKEAQAETQKKEEEVKKGNVEMKKFTYQDLLDAGFGKPFFAIKIDYRYGKYKEERITKGDALCKFLGYEKAVKSIVSGEINPLQSEVDKNGLIIDTTLGFHSKEPDLYTDKEKMFTVRKYEEITCAKRKDKTVADSDAVLKEVVEDLIVLNSEINPLPKIKTGQVDDSGRKTDGKKTPNGYKDPWGDKQSATTTLQK